MIGDEAAAESRVVRQPQGAMRILVVDDDSYIRSWLSMVLREDGYYVDAADTAERGRQLGLSMTYDLAILDLDLPDRSGLGVVQALRQAGRVHPIVILTGRDDEDAIVAVLDAGADDYLVKPVSNAILRARVRAALRRGGATPTSMRQVGNTRLDQQARRVYVGKAEVPLTAREFDLFAFLVQRAGQLVTRADLLERVWKMQFDSATNVVDATMSRLRAKLRAQQSDLVLQAERGRGYSLLLSGDSTTAASDAGS